MVCVLLLLFSQILLSRYYMVNADKAAIKMQKKMIEQQYQVMKARYEDSRKELHNKRYELRYMESKVNMGSEVSSAAIWTGHTELDILLYTVKQRCDEKRIDFQMFYDAYDIPLEIADLFIIMGNLLDNAVEAAALSPEKEREIRLTLRTVNEMLVLKISNSYKKEPLQSEEGRFRSVKNGPEHGWGIESVRDIVKQYHGSMEIEFADGKFTVTILVN